MKLAIPATRHQRILALLRDQGEVRISALSQQFGVTSMTAWRDLKILEELGLLRRVRGGALESGKAAEEFDFESKVGAAWSAKMAIAHRAVKEFVREGDVIALEGGTTAAALVEALPEQRVSILTNSLPVALRVRQRRPALPVRVIGGDLSPTSGNTTGPEALRELRNCHTSTCFLSATGWDDCRGPMDPNPLEIEVKRALAACSERVILLMDHRKFVVNSGSILLHPRRIHALVTDQAPPKQIRKLLGKHGVLLSIL